MREYLRTCTDWLDVGGGSKCTKIVAFAPAPIESKIPVLELIAEQTERDTESDYYDPAKMAKYARIALEERYNNPPGTEFRLYMWDYSEETGFYGDVFTDFERAVRMIKELQIRGDELDECSRFSFSIEKYIPNENLYCTWILNRLGEIWYFDYEDKFAPPDYDKLWDYLGDHLNLPTPFQAGDIVNADCRPFAEDRRVLILDIGDNRDCCSLQCLFITPDGTMSIGAFKHNDFLRDDEMSHISGLYRAERFTGALSEEESPLDEISKNVKANPALGSEIWDYIFKTDTLHEGVSWEQLQSEFKLWKIYLEVK